MDEKVSVRDQVLAMLKEGVHTREQIAKALNTSVASVSSQFTYLRWMGHYIVTDENKVMRLATKEEYEAIQASRQANKKSRTTKATVAKTPAEQYLQTTEQIASLEKQITTWTTKLDKVDKDLAITPNDLELQEMQAEAAATLTLKKIALRKAQAKLTSLPMPSEEELAELRAKQVSKKKKNNSSNDDDNSNNGDNGDDDDDDNTFLDEEDDLV